MHKKDFARFVEGTADPAFVVDGQGVVVAWNAPAHDLLGITARQAIGQSCSAILRGTDECGAVCSHNCTVRQAAGRHHRVANFDMQVRTARGRQWCNVSVVVARAEGSIGAHAIHILRCIDLNKRLEMMVRDFVVANTGLTADEAAALLTSRRSVARETELSKRETEVLGLLARGGTTRSVASQLHISRTTVNNHVQHILRKLNAHTRLEAIHRAEHAGLI